VRGVQKLASKKAQFNEVWTLDKGEEYGIFKIR